MRPECDLPRGPIQPVLCFAPYGPPVWSRSEVAGSKFGLKSRISLKLDRESTLRLTLQLRLRDSACQPGYSASIPNSARPLTTIEAPRSYAPSAAEARRC